MIEPAGKVRKRRRLAVALLLIGGAIAATVAASSARRSPAPKLPDPNGYDDFVKAGRMVKGEWPAKGNLAKAPVPDVRAFVEANKAVLDLARIGLGSECMVPIENNSQGLEKHHEEIGPVRAVGRLLNGEGIVAEADGRIADAARAWLDEMALGQAVTQGGMGTDQAVGMAIQTPAIIGLRKIRDRLPAAQIPVILRELEAIDARRVPLEAVEARYDAWYRGTFNPFSRVILHYNGVEKAGKTGELAVVKQRSKVERDLHFLLAELAIHAYHEDKGSWPRSLKDLVPAYLKAVPIDPNTGKPVDYPASEKGELTDDLSAIARPDGQVKPAGP